MIGEYARAKSLFLASQGKKRYLASGMTKNALDRILAARKMMGNAYHDHDVSPKTGTRQVSNRDPKVVCTGALLPEENTDFLGFLDAIREC